MSPSWPCGDLHREGLPAGAEAVEKATWEGAAYVSSILSPRSCRGKMTRGRPVGSLQMPDSKGVLENAAACSPTE